MVGGGLYFFISLKAVNKRGKRENNPQRKKNDDFSECGCFKRRGREESG